MIQDLLQWFFRQMAHRDKSSTLPQGTTPHQTFPFNFPMLPGVQSPNQLFNPTQSQQTSQFNFPWWFNLFRNAPTQPTPQQNFQPRQFPAWQPPQDFWSSLKQSGLINISYSAPKKATKKTPRQKILKSVNKKAQIRK